MEMLGHKIYDVQAVMRERHQKLMYDLFGTMGALKGRFPTANQTHGGPERERALDALYDAILETGSTAVFDNPFPVIAEELLQRSPNAKVSESECGSFARVYLTKVGPDSGSGCTAPVVPC